MKYTELKKSQSKMSADKLSTSPVTQVKDNNNHLIPQEWEVPYIDSKQLILTEHGIFHFEMVLKSIYRSGKYKTVSRIKVCPHTVMYKDCCYTFFINPVDKISVCRSVPNMFIKWKEGILCNPVYSPEECTPEEQFNKHKVLLENFIENEYIEEILNKLETALLKQEYNNKYNII